MRKLVRKKETAARIGFHPVHLMRLVAAGKFPAPCRIGENSIAFVESEVDAWIETKVAERDAKLAAREQPLDEGAAAR